MKLKRLVVFLFFAAALSFSSGAQVVINEFMASNGSGLTDEDGEFSDWIEIQNQGTDAVNLSGWALTDDAALPHKWEFPTTPIAAGGYAVVFASGKNRVSPKLHTNFSLDADGEYLALVKPDGSIASEFNPFVAQRRDVSYGLQFGTQNLVFFTAPTPGAANTTGVVSFVKDTKFSLNRGFYDVPFDLTLTCDTAAATIRYTTNGVPPTATSGTVYTGPIHVAGTTTIRAAAFKSGYQPSNVDTQTYIFLDDVIHQSANGAPPPGWPSSWGGNSVDYGMDPDVVNNPKYKDTIKNDLKTLPCFSVVMRLPDLFDSSTGIYANAGQDGRDWERPCSVELIYPDGTKGFQENAGIRIRGGFSRSGGNPKHAFRFFFREDYGHNKLKYPVFGPEAAQEFEGFDLRTFQNYSWSFQGDANAIFIRDVFSRDTQLAMGYNAERGDYFHLYINGQYWGLYNTCERTEASYAEQYFGGNKADYDVIKVEAGPYTINATDGNMTAWTTLYNLCKLGLSSDAAYQKVLGNNPDGTPNPAYPVLVDVDNLIDYMLLIVYTGNLDAPISNFIGNTNPNNWYGVRNRNADRREGFRFFAHDSEHTLLPWDLDRDRTGPFPAGDSSVTTSSPQWVWQKMWANPEFKLRVADRVQKLMFDDGVLTPAQNAARLMIRKTQIDRAVVGESARWGDAKVGTPYTRDTWVTAINNVLNNWFPQRHSIVLGQLKAKGLYPSVAAPTFNQHGGNINAGFSLTMSGPSGNPIYYTLDGSDPRVRGGAIAPNAIRYNGAINLNESLTVKARVLSGGGIWSALNEATFTIIRTYRDLMVTELMYNPLPNGNTNGDTFEFIELKNVGGTELDLSGVHFTNGVEYTFPNGAKVSPNQFVVLVNNTTNFASRYPNVHIAGIYTNNLSNSGETIALVHAAGGLITSFTYSDKAPWPKAADGTGFSLVPTTTDINADFSDPVNWRASSNMGGSPGADDSPVSTPPVIINEILTHTDPPQVDAIEVFNPTDADADISGWFLTDDRSTPKKFQVPGPTVIPAQGYKVFTEADFNPAPGVAPSFTLDSHGEEVYLFSADASGNLTGYANGFSFGTSENGVSFGRYINSAGQILYPPQKQLTLGAANSGPRVGPVVINEVRYQPAPGEEEFVELKNITGQAVKLYDADHPTNTWKIDGINFVFPQNLEIPANGLLVISATDPALFRSRNGVPQAVQVLGPYSGTLQDNGELLEVTRPDAPDTLADGKVLVPYITVDAVRYSNETPWPLEAAGAGPSIERINSAAFGNDPSNWRASPGQASPGLNNDGNRPPLVNAGADQSFVSGTFPFAASFSATAKDDGIPNGQLAYEWSVSNGPGEVQITDGDKLSASFAFPGTGTYVLRFKASDGELESSDDLIVSISRPLASSILLPKGSIWKYLDDGSDQGTNWRQPSFDDSTWKSGPAQLGYDTDGSENDEATIIGYGPNPGNKYVTYYFRRTINLDDASGVASLKLSVMRDDGVIVYLNGTEVFRDNLPTGDVTFQTYASTPIGGADESTYHDKDVDPALLKTGKNVIAVEMHQANASSSDISFDFELSAQVDFSNKAPTASAGPDISVVLPNVAQLNGSAADDGLPNPPGVFSATWTILDGPGPVSFGNANLPQTTASFSSAGTYTLRLIVTDGSLTAQDDVKITVTGGDAYATWQAKYFTAAELKDPAISGDNADPDADGFTNKQEFIAGTDPHDHQSYLHVANVGIENQDVLLRFEAMGDKSYTIQSRDLMGSGPWQRVVDLSPQGTTKMLDVLDPVIQGAREKYYRIVTPAQPAQ